MYSARTHDADLLLQKPCWWTASDRWIPPQRVPWTRPLLQRLRMLRRGSFGGAWRRVT